MSVTGHNKIQVIVEPALAQTADSLCQCFAVNSWNDV